MGCCTLWYHPPQVKRATGDSDDTPPTPRSFPVVFNFNFSKGVFNLSDDYCGKLVTHWLLLLVLYCRLFLSSVMRHFVLPSSGEYSTSGRRLQATNLNTRPKSEDILKISVSVFWMNRSGDNWCVTRIGLLKVCPFFSIQVSKVFNKTLP